MLDTFEQLKKENFKDYFVNEASLDHLGQSLRDHPDAALEVFKITVELYPKSSKAYSSLGDGYYSIGENDLAISNYSKALELNSANEIAKEMLKKLKK